MCVCVGGVACVRGRLTPVARSRAPRTPAAAPPRCPVVDTDRVLQAVVAVLQSNPPRGIDPAYLNRFVNRYRNHLAAVIEQYLTAANVP